MGLMKLRAMQGKRAMTPSDQIKTDLMATDAEPEKFTATELYACISREIAMRLQVYPNRVITNKMTLADAMREMQMMKTILLLIEKSEHDMINAQNQFDLFKDESR